MSRKSHCTATCKSGKPCPWWAMPNTGRSLCFTHDPELRPALRERATAGGYAKRGCAERGTSHPKGGRVDLSTAEARRDYLNRFAHSLLFGDEPAVDRAALVGAATKLVDKAREQHVEQLERENVELRQIIGDHVPEARRKLAIVKAPAR